MNGNIVAECATTREQWEREQANAARYELEQATDQALRELAKGLRAAARFARSSPDNATQRRGDRHWHQLLVGSHLGNCVAALAEIGVTR